MPSKVNHLEEQLQQLLQARQQRSLSAIEHDLLLQVLRDLYAQLAFPPATVPAETVVEIKVTEAPMLEPVPPQPPVVEKVTTVEKSSPMVVDTTKQKQVAKTSIHDAHSGKSKKGLHEKLAPKDLKQLMSLNLRMSFTKELFSGNAAQLNSALEVLNSIGNAEESAVYIQSELVGNNLMKGEGPVFEEFMSLVMGRFEG